MKTGELSHGGAGRRRRLISTSRKPGAGGEGDLEQHQGARTRFGVGGGGGEGGVSHQSSALHGSVWSARGKRRGGGGRRSLGADY
jgi:hypothetical protein